MWNTGDRARNGRDAPPLPDPRARAARAAFVALALSACFSCSAGEIAPHVAGSSRRHGAGAVSDGGPLASDGGGLEERGRSPLGEPEQVALDFEILPVAGERSALFVAEDAEGSIAAVR